MLMHPEGGSPHHDLQNLSQHYHVHPLVVVGEGKIDGYDNDLIHDCLDSFVQNRNTLIQAADEHALEQYLVTTIPETVPGKRRGKKQLVKLLVLCWGGDQET